MATIGTGWVDGAWAQAGWVDGAWSSAASASLSGTISDGVTEAELVAGGETLIITLVGDTWVAFGATFNAQRQAILDGLDADGVEATGWDAEVRDKELVTAVVRTSNTVVTITLTAAPDYDVAVDETITVTVPASAVAGSDAIVAGTTFDATFIAVIAEDTDGGSSWFRSQNKRSKLLREDDDILAFVTTLVASDILDG